MDESIVQQYQPILKFSKNENFFPMSVDDYLKDCLLFDGLGQEAPTAATPALLKTKPGERYCLIYADKAAQPMNLANLTRSEWPGALDMSRTQAAAKPSLLLNLIAAARFLPPGLLPPGLALWLAQLAVDWLGVDRAKIDNVEDLANFVLDLLKEEGRDSWEKARNLLGPLFLSKKVLNTARDQYRAAAETRRTYYYHIVPKTDSGGCDAVEYWYFYAFNDGLNWHEADWENVTLFFRDDKPFHAEYCFHSGHQGGPLDCQPTVYVARGSHASYASLAQFEFVDIFEEGGETVSEWDCQPMTDILPDWIGFQGKWGIYRQEGLEQLADRLGGPPSGPMLHQPLWSNPIAWAGL